MRCRTQTSAFLPPANFVQLRAEYCLWAPLLRLFSRAELSPIFSSVRALVLRILSLWHLGAIHGTGELFTGGDRKATVVLEQHLGEG